MMLRLKSLLVTTACKTLPINSYLEAFEANEALGSVGRMRSMIHAKSSKNIWPVLFVVIIVSFDNEVVPGI